MRLDVKSFVLLGWVMYGGACGGSSGGAASQEIAAGPLSGTVGGQPWSVVSGETNAFLSSDSSDFFTTLYEETVAPCTNGGNFLASNQLIIEVPKMPGDYSKAVTFVVDPEGTNQNLIAIGRVVVSEVTATTVSGGVSARYDANNSVSGQFQASICTQ